MYPQGSGPLVAAAYAATLIGDRDLAAETVAKARQALANERDPRETHHFEFELHRIPPRP